MSEYKIKKQDVFNNKNLYYELATYCNEHNCVLTEDEKYYIAEVILPPTFKELKQTKYKQIASDRYNFEISGITINDVEFKTDRESVMSFKNEYDEALNNSEYTVNWKASNKWVTLNAEEIKVIYKKIKSHIQSAFDMEMILDNKIDKATTEEELDNIIWEMK